MQRDFFKIAITALTVGSAGYAWAQSREQMVRNYIEERQKNPALYQSPPITHLVPNFNTITYAGAIDYEQIQILPSDEQGNVQTSSSSNVTLDIKGYSVAPHLAMSLKRVGLGLSVATMHKEVTYNASYRQGDGTSAGYSQLTTLDASGYGFNISFLPFSRLSKSIKFATILGTKSYNATHRSGNSVQTNESSTSYMQVRRYTVQRYELGLNVGLQLLRAFRLVPWADYSYTVVNAASDSVNNSSPSYLAELDLFWKDQPDFRYGLNVALSLGGFDVSIGGLLGTLGHLNSTPEFIKDDSLSITLSWDQKGS